MSLKAHLPLGGDVQNVVGIENAQASGITYTQGVVNQAAVMNAGTITLPVKLGAVYSVAFWLRLKSTTSGSYRKFFQCLGPGTDRSPGFWFHRIDDRLHMRQAVDGANSGADTITRLTVGDWYHVIFTCEALPNNTTRLQSWVNGVLETSSIAAGFPTYNDSPIELLSQDYDFGDFRVYDHVLNKSEAVELAKAKTLHYTMDGFQEPTVNLVDPATLGPYSPYHGLSWDGRKITLNIVDGTAYLTLNISGYSPTGKTLAVSGYMKRNGVPYYPHENARLSTYQLHADFRGTYFDPVTGYFESVQYYSASSSWIYHMPYSLTAGDLITIEDFQIEEKDHVTPYVVDSREGIVQDKSGQGQHASLDTRTPAWVEDAKLGKGCYFFNGTNATITIPHAVYRPYYTIALWISPEVQIGNSFIFSSYLSFMLEMSGGGFRWRLWDENGNPMGFPRIIHTPGEWYHTAVVVNGTQVTTYVNGELQSTQTFPVNAEVLRNSIIELSRNGWWSSGNSKYRGRMDDLRIYSNVLSSDDIRTIYHRRGSVDIDGNLTTTLIKQSPSLVWKQFGGPLAPSVGSNLTHNQLHATTDSNVVLPFEESKEFASHKDVKQYDKWINRDNVVWYKWIRTFDANGDLYEWVDSAPSGGPYEYPSLVKLYFPKGVTMADVLNGVDGQRLNGQVSMYIDDRYYGKTDIINKYGTSTIGFANPSDPYGEPADNLMHGWGARHVIGYNVAATGRDAVRCQFSCWNASSPSVVMEVVWGCMSQ